MKKLTTTLLAFTLLSAPAFAESPMQRDLHSWGYVQQKAYPQVVRQPADRGVMQHNTSEYRHNDMPAHHERAHSHHHHADKGAKAEHKHHHKHHGDHAHKKAEKKEHKKENNQ